MKAIFHLHTNYSHDALISVPYLIDEIHKKNITVLAITEHNNMDSYPVALEYIKKKNYPILLIPAEEIATQQGEVIGLFLNKAITKGLSLEETLQQIKQQGGVVYVPHPFDKFRKERIRNKDDLIKYIDDFDIIEAFNARSLQGNKESERFAKKHQKLILWGPDAHFKSELWNCVFEIPHFSMNKESFLNAVAYAKPLSKKRTFSGAFKSFLLKRWKKMRAKK